MTEPMAEPGRLIKLDGPKLGHIPAFDGFRGLFVMQVLLYHAFVTDFLRGSPIVIDWFFVASGFLITSLLLDEHRATGANNLRTFYQRRALRLFPAMYLMIAIFVVIMLLAITFSSAAREALGPWWIEALAAATYCYYIVAAFMPGELDGALGHTWSLTVEEQFYFIWPLFLVFTLRRRRRRSDRNLIVGAVAFIAVVMGARVGFHNSVVVPYGSELAREMTYFDENDPTWQGIIYRIASARPDMIVYGCLLAFVNRAIPRPVPATLRRWITIAGMAAWVSFFVFIAGGDRLPGFALFGGPVYQVALLMLAPMILDLYLRQESLPSRMLAHPVLRWLGVRSYGIYLWHIPVLLPVLPAINNTYGPARLVMGLFATGAGVVAGVLSYRFIERPFLRLKDTRFQRPQDLTGSAERSPKP
jgi:peptidoglycan/LPS O-acetylase OafA/YrhL